MTRFAFRNLLQRRTRTSISVAAIAAQVALVSLLIGLCTGTLRESGQRIENIRADILILPPGGQALLAMSSAVMPLEPVRAALEATPGVRIASPIVIATTNKYGRYSMIFGIEPRSWRQVGRGSFSLLEGHGLEHPYDLVVDRRLAREHRLVIGQKVELLNRTFTVAGIVRDGAGVRLYLPIATLQDLLGRQGKATAFFARCLNPTQAPEVLERLRTSPAFKGYKLISNDQYAELLGTATFGVREFIAAVTAMALVFGFVIISLAMYTSIMERTRQIGILKSLGADPAYIARAFVVEATLISLLGIPTGFTAAWLIKQLLEDLSPTLFILLTPRWMLYTTLISLTGALLGSLYPAVRASKVDPVIALSYD